MFFLFLLAVDFQTQVKPALEKSCFPCHSAARAAGGLKLHTKAAAAASLKDGSLLSSINEPPDSAEAMPPGGPQLDQATRDAIRQWIAAGAPWPAGVVLGAIPAAAPKDDLALVRQMHQRIAANSKAHSQEKTMQPYADVIPGTGVNMEMVPIKAGTFTMGTPETEKGRRKDEGPQRKMAVEAFWMGKFEVTWNQYRLFMFEQLSSVRDPLVDGVSRPTKPYVEMSFGMGVDGFPAISMTQHAANKFAQWLSAKTSHFYRLPTEAEWEYACRAGTTTAYSFGDDATALTSFGWFTKNAPQRYEPVGKKKPNAWGLHDMHGNVSEWTLDQYAPYAATPAPWVKATEPYPHAVRGGAWTDPAEACRCGSRLASDLSWKMQDPQLPQSIWYLTDAQFLGLRLVRPLQVPPPEELFKIWNNGVEHE